MLARSLYCFGFVARCNSLCDGLLCLAYVGVIALLIVKSLRSIFLWATHILFLYFPAKQGWKYMVTGWLYYTMWYLVSDGCCSVGYIFLYIICFIFAPVWVSVLIVVFSIRIWCVGYLWFHSFKFLHSMLANKPFDYIIYN